MGDIKLRDVSELIKVEDVRTPENAVFSTAGVNVKKEVGRPMERLSEIFYLKKQKNFFKDLGRVARRNKCSDQSGTSG